MKKDVKESANKKMETLVEQFNELQGNIQELQGRLQEVQTEIVKQQGYLEALKDLDDRERQILLKRRLSDDPLTLEELSKYYGISRERVRQVEVRAYEKIRKVVKNISYKTSNSINKRVFD